MAQNDVKMAKNASKGSKMEQNGRFPGKKWLKMYHSRYKVVKSAQELVENGQKLFKKTVKNTHLHAKRINNGHKLK